MTKCGSHADSEDVPDFMPSNSVWAAEKRMHRAEPGRTGMNFGVSFMLEVKPARDGERLAVA
jgi:hypothetical protein